MSHPRYGFEVRWYEPDDGYVATCPSFPSLSALGKTPEEALREAKVVLEMLIEGYEEEGVPLPPAKEESTYSGQFRLRLPKSLHAALAKASDGEGVAMNTYAVTLIAHGLGLAQSDRASTAQLAEVYRLLSRLIEQQEDGSLRQIEAISRIAASIGSDAGEFSDEYGAVQCETLRGILRKNQSFTASKS